MLNTRFRSFQDEIMDDFDLDGDELRKALDQISSINQLLGGNKVTLAGVKKLWLHTAIEKEWTIVDLGCGNGDMLRHIANYARKKGIRCKLIGIDANAFTVSYAQDLSASYPEISYQVIDIFSTAFTSLRYDIAICTLTLHHFKDEDILYLLKQLSHNAQLGVVINDLHRSKLAYRLFQFISPILRLNSMAKNDGLVSILRGFKKSDFERYSKLLNLQNNSIRWKWAFRYQWIISKI